MEVGFDLANLRGWTTYVVGTYIFLYFQVDSGRGAFLG
jgi:hypothetical protein